MHTFSTPYLRTRSQQNIVKLSFAALLLLSLIVATIIIAWARFAKEPGNTISSTHVNEISTVTPEQELLVPITRIEEGSVLNPKLFSSMKLSTEVTPLGLVKINELDAISGTYAKRLLLPNTPISHDDITPYAPLSKIKIPEGFRAISIGADRRSLIDGLLKPNSRVDVLWHYTNPKGDSKVKTLVPFVKVLALNGSTDPAAASNPGDDNTATLLVSRNDASRIELAAQEGKISMSLYGSTTGYSSGVAKEATKKSLYDPSDLEEEENEGTLITTSKSGNLIEWSLKNRKWHRNTD